MFFIDEINNAHSHDIRQTLDKKMQYSVTEFQIKNITELTEKGISAGRIRILERLYYTPNALYGIIRKVIQENEKKRKKKEKEMNMLLKEMIEYANWRALIVKDKK